MGRSWTCLFFGHDWVEGYSFQDIRGYGKMAKVSYIICRRCALVEDAK